MEFVTRVRVINRRQPQTTARNLAGGDRRRSVDTSIRGLRARRNIRRAARDENYAPCAREDRRARMFALRRAVLKTPVTILLQHVVA